MLLAAKSGGPKAMHQAGTRAQAVESSILQAVRKPPGYRAVSKPWTAAFSASK